MTREEAIKNLEKCLEYLEGIGLRATRENVEAVRMSIEALRAQQTPAKPDRSRWEGCEYCQEAVPKWCFWKFCPACGKPLTEEAWAELERREEADNETD